MLCVENPEVALFVPKKYRELVRKERAWSQKPQRRFCLRQLHAETMAPRLTTAYLRCEWYEDSRRSINLRTRNQTSQQLWEVSLTLRVKTEISSRDTVNYTSFNFSHLIFERTNKPFFFMGRLYGVLRQYENEDEHKVTGRSRESNARFSDRY